MDMDQETKEWFKEIAVVASLILCGIIAIVALIWGACALSQVYTVWSSAQDGKAELARADFNRQIAVREAEAKMDAAVDLAKAEIIRAEGLAKANKILGDSLKGPEGEAYLRYLWIENIATTKDQIIYVPSQGGLPIIEAGRLK